MRAVNRSSTQDGYLPDNRDLAPARNPLLRSASAAAAGLTADVSLLVILVDWASLDYLPASPLCFLAGLVVLYAFALSPQASASHYSMKSDLPILAGIALAGLGLSVLSMLVLVESLGLGYLEAKALTALATAVFAVSALGKIIFAPTPHRPRRPH